jgi:hypothetical protein
MGAALFVVQLALEIIVSVRLEYDRLHLLQQFLYTSDGADKITFFAPAIMCAFKSSKVLYLPVASIT